MVNFGGTPPLTRRLGMSDLGPTSYTLESEGIDKRYLNATDLEPLRALRGTNLRSLKLHNLWMTGPQFYEEASLIEKLFSIIQTNSAFRLLGKLELTSCHFPQTKVLCQFLQTNQTLTELNLESTRFMKWSDKHGAHNGVLMLINALSIHKSLTALGLRGCGVETQGAHALADLLSTHPPLRKLDLSDNEEIENSGIAAIATAMTINTILTALMLSYVCRDEAEQLVQALAANQGSVLGSLGLRNSYGLTKETLVSLGRLRLRHLDLSETILLPAKVSALAEAIVGNSHLQELELYRCGVGGQITHAFANGFGGNTTTHIISPSPNEDDIWPPPGIVERRSWEGIALCPDSSHVAMPILGRIDRLNFFLEKIWDEEFLVSLEVSHLTIGSLNLDRLIRAILNNKSLCLQRLTLLEFEVNKKAMELLAQLLQTSGTLTDLSLRICTIHDDGLGKALADNSTLLRLDLSNNIRATQLGLDIAIAMRANTTLRTLGLSCIDREAAMELVQSLAENEQSALESLYLDQPKQPGGYLASLGNLRLRHLAVTTTSPLLADKVFALAQSIGNNTRLTELDLSSCGIRLDDNDDKISSLAAVEALSSNTILNALTLSNNWAPLAGPELIARNTCLMQLDLSDCGIGMGGHQQSVPALIGALSSNTTLRALKLAGNVISVTEAVAIIRASTSLNSLVLPWNIEISMAKMQEIGGLLLARKEPMDLEYVPGDLPQLEAHHAQYAEVEAGWKQLFANRHRTLSTLCQAQILGGLF